MLRASHNNIQFGWALRCVRATWVLKAAPSTILTFVILTFHREKCVHDRTSIGNYKTPRQSVVSGWKYRVEMLKVSDQLSGAVTAIDPRIFITIFHSQLLSKFLSPGTLSVRRNESLFRQCRLFSQTTTEPSIKSSEAVPPANTLETTEAEDDKLYKRLELELRGVDPAVLNSFTTFAVTAAKHLNIEVGRWWVISFHLAKKERFPFLYYYLNVSNAVGHPSRPKKNDSLCCDRHSCIKNIAFSTRFAPTLSFWIYISWLAQRCPRTWNTSSEIYPKESH